MTTQSTVGPVSPVLGKTLLTLKYGTSLSVRIAVVLSTNPVEGTNIFVPGSPKSATSKITFKCVPFTEERQPFTKFIAVFEEVFKESAQTDVSVQMSTSV
jgi:ABC-type sulfate transport system substrate-binding protein